MSIDKSVCTGGILQGYSYELTDNQVIKSGGNGGTFGYVSGAEMSSPAMLRKTGQAAKLPAAPAAPAPAGARAAETGAGGGGEGGSSGGGQKCSIQGEWCKGGKERYICNYASNSPDGMGECSLICTSALAVAGDKSEKVELMGSLDEAAGHSVRGGCSCTLIRKQPGQTVRQGVSPCGLVAHVRCMDVLQPRTSCVPCPWRFCTYLQPTVHSFQYSLAPCVRSDEHKQRMRNPTDRANGAVKRHIPSHRSVSN